MLSLWMLLSVSGPHVQQTLADAPQGWGRDQTIRANPASPPSAQDPPPSAPQRKEVKGKEGEGEGPIVRETTEVVSLTVTVTDKNQRSISGLARDHFEIFDNKIKQKIEYFKEGDAPLSLGIIFDVSSSMRDKLHRAREALKAFVEARHQDDDYFLVTFNDYCYLAADFGDSQAILRRLAVEVAGGSTALYDALYLGLDKVAQGRHHKRALLVISDGEDNSSRHTLGDLRKLIRESDVQIYCIGIPEALWSLSGLGDSRGQAILDQIAKMTGGRAFFPNLQGELEDAVTRIAVEMRRQYSIGYVPTPAPQPGQYHKIKVSVHPPSGYPPLKIRSKEGYYSALRAPEVNGLEPRR